MNEPITASAAEKVFISYRHKSIGMSVSAVRDGLHRTLGEDRIAIDVEFLKGVPLPVLLRHEVESCGALLVLIDAHWIDDIDRLADPDDCVRLEIITALTRGIPVIPVFLDESRLPPARDLPEELAQFPACNGHHFRGDVVAFDIGINQLCWHIERVIKGQRWAAAAIGEVLKVTRDGHWELARHTLAGYLRAAEQQVERWANRAFPELKSLERRLLVLWAAAHAFDQRHFAAAKLILGNTRASDPTARCAYHFAEIALAAADALYQHDRNAFVKQQQRFGNLCHILPAASVVPGQVEVGKFLDIGRNLFSRMAELNSTAEHLYQEAVWHSEDQGDTPLTPALVAEPLSLSEAPAADVEPGRVLVKHSGFSLDAMPPFGSLDASIQASMLEWVAKGDATVAARELFARSLVGGSLLGRELRPFERALWTLVTDVDAAQRLSIRTDFSRPRISVPLPAPGSTDGGDLSAFPFLGCTLDGIDFTVTAPGAVAPGSDFPVAVWVHVMGEDGDYAGRMQRRGIGALLREDASSPAETPSILSFRLRDQGLTPRQSEGAVRWDGDAVRALFVVRCPAGSRPGICWLKADVYLDRLKVVTLTFSVEIAKATSAIERRLVTPERARRVFVSFSNDAEHVVARLEQTRHLTPSRTLDLRCHEHRRRPDWPNRMSRFIRSHDLFYLVWSLGASRSESVTREWHCALSQSGPDFISAVVIGDNEVAPPRELRQVPFYRARWPEGRPR